MNVEIRMNADEWAAFEKRTYNACEARARIGGGSPVAALIDAQEGSGVSPPRPVPKLVGDRLGVDWMVLEALAAGYDGWPLDERYDKRAYKLGLQLRKIYP